MHCELTYKDVKKWLLIYISVNFIERLNCTSDNVRSVAGYKVNTCWYASVTVVKEGK